MHFRRLTCLLLGMWLGGSVIFAALSWRASHLPGQLIATPPPGAAENLSTAGRGAAYELLRYQSAEMKRRNAEAWGTAQVLLGAAVLAVLLFGTHSGKVPVLLAAAMLAAALLDRFFLTPEVVARGRMLDFAVPGTHDSERARLIVVNFARWGAQGFDAAGAVLLAGWLLRRRRGSGGVRLQIHAIDEADHRHIDR